MVTGSACLMPTSLLECFSLGMFLTGMGGERKGVRVTVHVKTTAKFSILMSAEITLCLQ